MDYSEEIQKLNQQQRALDNELDEIKKNFQKKITPIIRQKLQLAMKEFVEEYGQHFIENGEKVPAYVQLSFTGVYDDEGGTDTVIESVSLYDEDHNGIDLYFSFSHVEKDYHHTYHYEDMEEVLMEHLDNSVDRGSVLEQHIGHKTMFKI